MQNLEHHIPIRVSSLKGYLTLTFDIFLKVAGKYILYVRAGESLDEKRASRLYEKKIQRVFIRNENLPRYQDYLKQSHDIAFKNINNSSLEDRLVLLQGLQQANTEDMFDNWDQEGDYTAFKASTQKFFEFIVREPQALKPLMMVKNESGSPAHHGVNVAALSLSLAIEMRLGTPQDLLLMTVAAHMHDIGHQESGLNVVRPLDQLTPQELKLYRQHPIQAFEKLKTVPFYEPLTLEIIQAHHEHIGGTGFPHRLYEHQVNPLVYVVALCDTFDRMVSFEKAAPKEAMLKFTIDKLGVFPLPMIQHLSSLLKKRGIL